MNKKLLIGLITAAVAVVIAITIVILSFLGVFPFKKGDDTSKDDAVTSSQEDVIVDKGDLTFGSSTVAPGETVTVPIKLDKNPGIWGAQLSIVYDSNNLSVSACTNGEILDDFNYNDDGNGNVRIIITNSDLKDSKKNGLLCNLVMTVSENAPAGDYELQVANDSILCNVKEAIVTPEIKAAKITVS